LISAALLLYPSVTNLIDLQNTISKSSSILGAIIKMRDNLVMQVLGYILLYLFLGTLLYYHKEQPIQQVAKGINQLQVRNKKVQIK
jgi:hypothetical protein